MIEGIHAIHQYQFTKTGSISGGSFDGDFAIVACTSSETEHDGGAVTYSKEDFKPENRQELLGKMLKSMSKVDDLPQIRKIEDTIDATELYATTINNGKICISGVDGYQHKARAYEKLVNASMSQLWSRMPNMSLVSETDVLDQASGFLKYYMLIDNDMRKADKSDSVANHIEEAYTKWQSTYMPQRYHFDGRI